MLRLRRILFSKPTIAAVVLFAMYLLGGYFALPAVVKWQLEKQVPAQLGHHISVGEVRFDPLTFRFEVGDLALADPDGRAMLGFKRLLVDFELRSVIDRAWTFAEATLEAPVLRLDLEKDGRHNFSALLDRLQGEEPEQASGRTAPIRGQARRADGWTHRIHGPPARRAGRRSRRAVADRYRRSSTLPEHAGSYRLSARTAAGETLEASGGLALDPVASKGRLTLGGVKVSTLARSVSRLLALEAPAGTIDFGADFDLALDRSGVISGVVQAVDLDVAALLVNAAGASVPLVAFETLSLKQGRVDFDKREATLVSLRLGKRQRRRVDRRTGTTRLDPVRPINARCSRGGEACIACARCAGRCDEAASSPLLRRRTRLHRRHQLRRLHRLHQLLRRDGRPAPTPEPWRISLASVGVADIALRLSDAAAKRSATVAAIGFEMAPTAEIAGADARVEIGKPKLSIKAAQFDSGADSFTAPGAAVEADGVTIVVAEGRIELALDAPRVALPDRLAARSGDTALELGSFTAKVDRVALHRADGAIAGTLAGPKIMLAGVSISGAAEGAQLRDLALEVQRLTLQTGPGKFDLGIDKARGTLADLKLRRGAAGVELRSGTITSEKLSVAQTDAGVRVVTGTPALSISSLVAHQGDDKATLGELSLDSSSIALASTAAGKLDFTLERIRTAASNLAMNRGGDGINLSKATLGGESIALTQGEGRFNVVGSGARASVAGVAARQGSDRIALKDALFEARAMTASSGGTSAAPSGVQARLEDVALQLASVGVVALGASSDFAQIGTARLGAKSLRLALPDGPADVTADGLTAALSDTVLRSPADASEMLRLGQRDAGRRRAAPAGSRDQRGEGRAGRWRGEDLARRARTLQLDDRVQRRR